MIVNEESNDLDVLIEKVKVAMEKDWKDDEDTYLISISWLEQFLTKNLSVPDMIVNAHLIDSFDQSSDNDSFVLSETALEGLDYKILPGDIWRLLEETYTCDCEIPKCKLAMDGAAADAGGHLSNKLSNRPSVGAYPQLEEGESYYGDKDMLDGDDMLPPLLSSDDVDNTHIIATPLTTTMETNDYNNNHHHMTPMLQSENTVVETDTSMNGTFKNGLEKSINQKRLDYFGSNYTSTQLALFDPNNNDNDDNNESNSIVSLDDMNSTGAVKQQSCNGDYKGGATTTVVSNKRIKLTKKSKGLTNLGNTCYMNATLQCLVNIPELRDYLVRPKKGEYFKNEINTESKLNSQGEVVSALAELVIDLFSESEGKYSYMGGSANASNFRRVLVQYLQMFRGYGQHDAHEFGLQLVDLLHEDVNKIILKPYVEKYEKEQHVTDNEAASISWENYLKRDDSFFVKNFHGLSKTTLRCNKCDNAVVTFDPFCFLSLPLPGSDYQKVSVIVHPNVNGTYDSVHSIRKVKVEIPRHSNADAVLSALSKQDVTIDDNSVLCEFWKEQIFKYYQPTDSIGDDSTFHLIYRLDITKLMNSSLTTQFHKEDINEKEFEVFLNALKKAEASGETTDIKDQSGEHADNNDNSENGEDLLKSDKNKQHNPLHVETAKFSISPISTAPTKLNMQQKMMRFYKGPCVLNYSALNKDRVKFIQESKEFLKSIRKPLKNDCDSGDKDMFQNVSSYEDIVAINELRNLIIDRGNNQKSHRIQVKLNTEHGLLAGLFFIELAFTDTIYNLRQKVNVFMSKYMKKNVGLALKVPLVLQKFSQSDTLGSIPVDHVYDEGNEKVALPTDETEMKNALDEIAVSQYSSNLSLVLKFPNRLLEVNSIDLDNFCNYFSVNEVELDIEGEDRIDLYSCIKNYTTCEQLEESEAWYCPKCRAHVQAFRENVLYSLPKTLIITLKRFSHGHQTGYRYNRPQKVDTFVDFPHNLSLNSFVKDPTFLHSFYADRTEKIVAQEYAEKVDDDLCKYKLVSVVNHYGGLGGGHYTAYAENDGKWYHYDDSRVSEISADNVITSSAYVLFYRRDDGQQTVFSDYSSIEEAEVITAQTEQLEVVSDIDDDQSDIMDVDSRDAVGEHHENDVDMKLD